MAVDTTYRRERPPLATAGLLRRHIQPVEFLFDPMKGIVTDLVARTHCNDGLPRGTQRRSMQFAVCGPATGSAIVATSVTLPRMPAQEIIRPLPMLGRSIGRGG